MPPGTQLSLSRTSSTFLALNDRWLRVPERITYKLCVLVHNCLHGTAPRYLQDVIQPVAVTSRRRLRSTSSSALVVPVTRRTTIGDRAFAVAGPRAWNSLPQFVTDSPSPGTFRKYLKTYLFSLSFWSTEQHTTDSVKRPRSSSPPLTTQ